ncbi:GDT1-like protein 1 chloroplastic [Zea mays]|uniref:GDT1-like protein 1 chloroplastic n=2 Tax=Zea mays TaxID=4577 RepID=A0A1D6FGW4_MAIZE|nr:GDT1-like protein 1 chloroplastic [Zea mays]
MKSERQSAGFGFGSGPEDCDQTCVRARSSSLYPLATVERKRRSISLIPARPATTTAAAVPWHPPPAPPCAHALSPPYSPPPPQLPSVPQGRRLALLSARCRAAPGYRCGRATRCLPKCDSGKPDGGGDAGLSGRKAARPAGQGGPRRPAQFGASSCGLAFTTVAGVIMLQASQQALAATQFAGLQPADVLGDLGDVSTGFASAFLLIFFSELGDRTFFIAALLAARSSGAVIFLGTFGALAVMTIISVVLGRAFHYVDGIIPFSFGGTDFPVDDIAAACLLVYYGVTTLLDAASGDDEKINEEQEEAELAVSKFSGNGAGVMSAAGTIASTFVLVFVAEWGDKSFFSTIALAAASSPLGVIAGSLAGHAIATLIAVLGGSLLGTFLSEKIIAYIGGSLFLAFAAITIVEIVT